MAAQPSFDTDDGIGLDDNDNQAPAQQSAPISTDISTSPNINPNPAPAEASDDFEELLTQLSTRIRPLHKLEPGLKHLSTHTLERQISLTHLQLAQHLFIQPGAYDHVCLARANWKYFSSHWDVGKFYTRKEFHLLLYSYVVKRSAALGVLLARGYEILDGGKAGGDVAFAALVQALVHECGALGTMVVDWPERGRGRTLMLEDEGLKRGLGVLGLPVRFAVRLLGGQEVVFFGFGDGWNGLSGGGGGKGWEVRMDVVGKGEGGKICGDEKYEI